MFWIASFGFLRAVSLKIFAVLIDETRCSVLRLTVGSEAFDLMPFLWLAFANSGLDSI